MNSPNHHLWWNRGSWWVAFTVLHDGYRQERIRRPLGTRDVEEARARRDRLMEAVSRQPGCTLSVRLPRSSGPLSQTSRGYAESRMTS